MNGTYIFEIVNRTIVPSATEELAVVNDNDSRCITFKIPSVIDCIDITDKILTVRYVNSLNRYDQFFCNTREVITDGNEQFVLFDWVLDSNVTSAKGIVTYDVSIYDTNDMTNVSQYILHTKPATFQVDEGLLDVGAPIEDENALQTAIDSFNAIAAKYYSDTLAASKAAQASADAAAKSAASLKVDTTLTISGYAADAKTVGDKLSEKADSSEVTSIRSDLQSEIDRAVDADNQLNEQLNNIQIDKLTVYTSFVVNANNDIFDGSVTNITDGSNVIGGDFIGKITGEIVHWFSCRLTIVNTGFQDFRKKHSKIKLALKCSAQTNLIVCATPNTSTFTGGGIWNSYISFNNKSVRIISIDLSGDEYNNIDRLCIQFILSCNNSTLYVTNTIGEYKVSYFIFDEDINFLSPKSSKCVEAEYAEYSCEAKHSEDSTRFAGHTENEFEKYKNFIVYYGDSLTMYGGWTQIVEQKSGMTGYNFGIGGENVPTIACRAGGDSMIVPAGVTIGKSASIVPIADKNGIGTLLGYKAFPNRNGSTNDLGKLVNPIYIGESKQPFLLYRSGSGDTESWGVAACDESLNIVSLSNPFVVNSPMLIRCSKNTEEYQSPKVLFIFIGTNSGGYETLDEYIMFNKLIQNHIGAQHTVFLGMTIGSSSGYFPSGQTITTYSDYYQRMKVEFGTSFIDLHDYLMKYGLIDAGMTPTPSDDEAILAGKIPTSLTIDGVHYTSTAKQLIGNYIYRRCCEINIF